MIKKSDAIKNTIVILSKITKIYSVKGGEGSGNFGHAGRPGEIGGSGPGSFINISPININPVNPITNKDKFRAIALSMEENGWQGPPILAYQDGETTQAITGSHRIYAAREANIDVPVDTIDVSNFSEDDVDSLLSLTEDEDRVALFESLNRRGLVTDGQLDLMELEVRNNYENVNRSYAEEAAIFEQRKKEVEKQRIQDIPPSGNISNVVNQESKRVLDNFTTQMHDKYNNIYAEMTDEEMDTLGKLERATYRKSKKQSFPKISNNTFFNGYP